MLTFFFKKKNPKTCQTLSNVQKVYSICNHEKKNGKQENGNERKAIVGIYNKC
jgi:hypothetical protein